MTFLNANALIFIKTDFLIEFFLFDTNTLIGFSLAKTDLDAFATQHQITRHPSFDWECNKARQGFHLPAIFLFECHDKTFMLSQFPSGIWLPFPQAVRALLTSQDRNSIQLAVQYLAEGTVDQSVLAASEKDMVDIFEVIHTKSE